MLCVSRSLTAGSTRSTLLDWARPLHALSPRLQSAPKTGLGQAQRTWLVDKAFTVPSFGGSLWVDSALPVRISPIGSLEYPNLDRAFVRLTVPAQSGLTKDCAQVDVKQEGHKLTVKNQNVLVEPKDKVRQEIQVPMVHNLNVSSSGQNSIKVKDMMESTYCHIKSEAGAVSATRIKTGNLTIQTVAGDVLCSGHIQGNVKVKSESGDFIGDKRFTGPSLEVETDSGDIRVASCYSDSSKFATNTGSMNLRNLHNVSYMAVYEKGNVEVKGMDGAANIFVKKGDIDCQISQVRAESRIHVEEGNVHLKISDTYPLKISIEANDVIPDAKFTKLGTLTAKTTTKQFECAIQPDKFSPSLLVIAENGDVIVDSQDWAASLGLKMPLMPDSQ